MTRLSKFTGSPDLPVIRVLTDGAGNIKVVGVDVPEDVKPPQDFDGWWGPEFVWRECYGSERPVVPEPRRVFRDHNGMAVPEGTVVWKCSGCDFAVVLGATNLLFESDEDNLCIVTHEVPANIEEQAQQKIEDIAVAMGFDRWDAIVTHARYTATRSETRRAVGESVDAMVAYGASVLSQGLITRAALPVAAKEISDLLSFKLNSNCWIAKVGEMHGYDAEDCEVSDDAPFFTEAVLYPLLGKDDARTVLAYVKAAARAVGASGDA